MQIFK